MQRDLMGPQEKISDEERRGDQRVEAILTYPNFSGLETAPRSNFSQPTDT